MHLRILKIHPKELKEIHKSITGIPTNSNPNQLSALNEYFFILPLLRFGFPVSLIMFPKGTISMEAFGRIVKILHSMRIFIRCFSIKKGMYNTIESPKKKLEVPGYKRLPGRSNVWINSLAIHDNAQNRKNIQVLFDLSTKTPVKFSESFDSSCENLYELNWLFSDVLGDRLRVFAKQKILARFKQFSKFIHSRDTFIREAAAANACAVNHKEFAILFNDPAVGVRRAAAKNPNAPLLPAYFNLLFDVSDSVRCEVAQNPNRSIILSKFGPHQNELTRVPLTAYSIASSLFGPNIPEYRLFFNAMGGHLRIQLARNPNAPIFPEFSLLFEDSDEEVRRHAAANPNAPSVLGYENLFKDKSGFVRMYAAANRNAPLLADFAILLEDQDKPVVKYARNNPMFIPPKQTNKKSSRSKRK